MWPCNLTYDLEQGKSEGFDSCDRPSNLKLDSNCRFFGLCDLAIWWMDTKNNRALPLYYVKLCATYQIHQWIQTGVTVRKRSIRVKIGDFWSRVTLKFDEWVNSNLSYSPETLNSGWNLQFFVPCDLEIWWMTLKNNRAAFLCGSSFVHLFIGFGEFKLELQSGNTQFESKSTIFCPVWSWKFDGWPWKTIGHLSYAASSFHSH